MLTTTDARKQSDRIAKGLPIVTGNKKEVGNKEDDNYWLRAEFKGFPMLAEKDKNRELTPSDEV